MLTKFVTPVFIQIGWNSGSNFQNIDKTIHVGDPIFKMLTKFVTPVFIQIGWSSGSNFQNIDKTIHVHKLQ